MVSTSGSRAASSGPAGTVNLTCWSVMRRFARVRRALIAGWVTSSTAAISAVGTPQTKRSARASRASGLEGGRADGEQQREPVVARGIRTGGGSATSSGSRSASRASRRTASMAMRFATVVSHAAGLMRISRSRAAAARANASCTASSASARSPVTRATTATSRGHSRRKTSSRAGVATGSG